MENNPRRKQMRRAIRKAAEAYLHASVVHFCGIYLDQFPDDALVWCEYAQSLSRFSRYPEAESALKHALAKGNELLAGFIFCEYAHSYERRGDYETAESYYLKAIDIESDATWNRIFLAMMTFKRGDLKLAERRYREAIATQGPEIDEAYANLGGVLVALERYEEAIDCYHKTLELDPQYWFAKFRIADAEAALGLVNAPKSSKTRNQKAQDIHKLMEDNQCATAALLCKSHLATYPEAFTIWIEYGRVLAELSRHTEADAAFKHARELSPELLYGVIAYSQGFAYKRRGDFNGAERAFLQAVEQEPEDPCFRSFLGAMAFLGGDLETAERRYQEALIRGGKCGNDAYADLGEIRTAQGLYQEAAECYRKAIEIDPDDKSAKHRLRDVENVLVMRM